jgi:hypothetical protein
MTCLHFVTQFLNYNGQSFGWTPFVIDAKLESTKYMGQNEALFGYVGELIGNLQNMLQTKNWV